MTTESELREKAEEAIYLAKIQGLEGCAESIRTYIDFLIKDREAHGRAAWVASKGAIEIMPCGTGIRFRTKYSYDEWLKSGERRENHSPDATEKVGEV